MSDRNENGPEHRGTGNSWPWATAWIATVLAVTGAGIYVLQSCRDIPRETLTTTTQVVTNIARAVADIAGAFQNKTVHTTFARYTSSLQRNQYLQFATLKQVEVFTQSDQTVTGFGYLPLPEVIVEARAPVEYTYYVDLNGPWDFTLRDNIIHVRAPRIRFNTPAIDASQITYEVKKGSFLRDHDEALANLKHSLTSLARIRARENVSMIRDTGRRQVAEFIETWLAKSFTDAKHYAVKVSFEGEPSELPLREQALE